MAGVGRRRGFTLLELVLVLSILSMLAAVASVVANTYVTEDAPLTLARRELLEVKKAVLQFHADTGWLPKQGPFALAPAGAVPVPAAGAPWFAAPANLAQLAQNPLAGTGHHLAAWDPDRRRGWRGPYLTLEGSVLLGDGLSLDGRSGNVDQGNALAAPVLAVADPFSAGPLAAAFGEACVWTPTDGAPPRHHGRPYLLFDLQDRVRARVVSPGPDGRYEPLGPPLGGAPQDEPLVKAGSDDLGVYLFR